MRRKSPKEYVIEYFGLAPITDAEATLGEMRALLRIRTLGADHLTVAPTASAKRKRGRPKKVQPMGDQTSLPAVG